MPSDVARDVAQEFVSAELAGTKTHGLGKLISMHYGDCDAEPTVKQIGSLLVVDGNGGSGFALFRTLAERLVILAKSQGVGIALVRNFSRYSSLYPYCERVVESGNLVALLANTAGPPAVAPFGGVDPITGTNPICIAVPTAEGPQSFDFSTAEVVWGEIRQAALEGRPLTPGAFLDADGVETVTPGAVSAVRAFGGSKGWALNLGLEILCGGLAGAAMGLRVNNEFDCGAFFMALDAQSFSGDLPSAVSELLRDVRTSRPCTTGAVVRVPGDRHRGLPFSDAELEMILDLPETTYTQMTLMAEGRSTAELADNSLFN